MSILVNHLSYRYDKGTPKETVALDDISFTIEKGEFVGLIGHTGSGKSTLIQHLNGLIRAQEGRIIVDGVDLTSPKTKLSRVRKKVGLVFQYPEYQLFEETVNRDVAFGPTNLGLSKDKVQENVRRALEMVGLDPETVGEKSPFELSGGQKRRVAIAGVLAMDPEVLVLDEPTAGLDPFGRDEILDQIRRLHADKGLTVILVSHSMEDVAKYCDRILVMDQAGMALDGVPGEVFKEAERLQQIGLDVPQVKTVLTALKEQGLVPHDDLYTVEDAAAFIVTHLGVKADA